MQGGSYYIKRLALSLRLVRWPNLIVVALTQLLIVEFVIHPALEGANVAFALHRTKLVELILITLCVTASGYIINDLQDEEIDRINRPGTNPLYVLDRNFALWFYGATVLAGWLLTNLFCFRLGEREFLWLYPVAVGILAIYSSYLKKLPLAGNAIVALYCAGVIALPVAVERGPLAVLEAADPAAATHVYRVAYLFMGIAVLATLLREVVKDLEDVEGDRLSGRQTVPIIWGLAASRYVVGALSLGVVAALVYPFLAAWPTFDTPILLTWSALLVLAFLAIAYQVQRARAKRDYTLISREVKLLLIGGLVLLLLI